MVHRTVSDAPGWLGGEHAALGNRQGDVAKIHRTVGNRSPGLPIDMGSPSQGSGHARGQVRPVGRVRPRDCGAHLCMRKHVLYFA
jgi:hypothetical protein